MWSNRLHEARSFFRHLWQSRGPHGVHSPFVYNLITVVLRNKNRGPKYNLIEQRRSFLRSLTTNINVSDYGAGSRVHRQSERRVGDIARAALQPATHARALSMLAKLARAQHILELGTSLGITTAHLADSLPNGMVYTLEGSESIAKWAEANWKELGLVNIDCTVGRFSDTLLSVLKRMPTVDFVIIDGDHRGPACLEYLEAILPFATEQTVIVLDDIYWSPSMTSAWEKCVSDARFTLTLDFFDFGVLYFTKGRVKEHFKLTRPWR